jgi:hypothetical protein
MARHKFKVGQVVDYTPLRLGGQSASRQYEVVRLLPADSADSGELQYRVKSKSEMFERVAKESELSRRSVA